jgi:putative hemolysin
LDDGIGWQWILLILLIGMSAFFSSSETAMMSLNKIRIRTLADENVRGAKTVSKLLENPNKLLGSVLVGNNIVNIGASAIATFLAIHYFGNRGVGIATGLMTFFVLVFGEITPKSLATRHAELIALKISGILKGICFVLSPVVALLLLITNALIRIFGGDPKGNRPFMTEEELKTLVTVSHEEGVLEGDTKEMLHNVFEFGDTRVRDVMTPRPDIVALDVESDYKTVSETFRSGQFSRLPVYQESIDSIIGILLVKDLIFREPDSPEKAFDLRDYLREVYFTFDFKKTEELFRDLREKRFPMAVVLDEYGGTVGIVTVEDLIEEIVGEIHDEYDGEQSEPEAVCIREGEYIVDGSLHLDDLEEQTGVKLESEDYDTAGGFAVGEFGLIPEVGDSLAYEGNVFVIEEMDRNRIRKMRMVVKTPIEEQTEEENGEELDTSWVHGNGLTNQRPGNGKKRKTKP